MDSEVIKRLLDSDLNEGFIMMWIAWAREFDSPEEEWRFTATMLLYNNLTKLGFCPLYATEMACGRLR